MSKKNKNKQDIISDKTLTLKEKMQKLRERREAAQKIGTQHKGKK